MYVLTKNNMDLGRSIKTIRIERGYNQKDLASACNLSQTYLSQIENNVKDPNLSAIKKIAKGLSVPLPILLFLAMDENDIPSGKKEYFKLIGPSMLALVQEFFLGGQETKPKKF